MIKSFCYAKLLRLILCCTFSDIVIGGTKNMKLNSYLVQNIGFEKCSKHQQTLYFYNDTITNIVILPVFKGYIFSCFINLSFSNTDTRFGISLYGTQGFDSCYLKQSSSQELYCISVFCFVLPYISFDRNAYTYQTCI